MTKARDTANLVSSQTGVAVTISGSPVRIGFGDTSVVNIRNIGNFGYVGLGTVTAGRLLHLLGNDTSCEQIWQNRNASPDFNALNLVVDGSSTDSNISLRFLNDAFDASSHFIWRYTSERHMRVYTSNEERIGINSVGNIGMGTPSSSLSSSSRLTLFEESGNAQTLEIRAKNNGAAGSQPGIKFTSRDGDNIGGIYGDGNSDTLRIQTGGTVATYINPGQVIGLKTQPKTWESVSANGIIQFGDYGCIYNDYNNMLYGFNFYKDSGGTAKYLTADQASYYHQDSNGKHIWQTAAAGSADAAITFSKVMEIDADGNVTKPLSSFCDTGETGSFGSAGSLVASPSSAKANYSSTVHNIGNDFSTSTDLYTCPVDGVYAISSSWSMGAYGSYRMICILSINGGYEEITEVFDDYENQSPTIIRKLSANDTIGVGRNDGTSYAVGVRLMVYLLG